MSHKSVNLGSKKSKTSKKKSKKKKFKGQKVRNYCKKDTKLKI